MPEVIDIMAEGPRPTTLANDPATAVRQLGALLERAGVPDQLGASKRLLDQGQQLEDRARAGRQAATQRWQAERERLFAGEVDTDRLARAVIELGPWLGDGPEDAAPVMSTLMQAVAQARSRALQMVHAEASGIFQRLQAAAAEVVAQVAGTPALPREVWSAPNGDRASTVAIQRGHELTWSVLVKAATRFEAIHQAAAMLVDSGGLGVLIYPDGCPSGVGMVWLNWVPASEGYPQLRRIPAPLRIRSAVDQGWRPGLWLPADHVAQAQPRRGLLATLTGR